MSCRVAMLRMERTGLLRLPTPQGGNGNGRSFPSQLQIPRPEAILSPGAEGLRLELVKTKAGSGWYQAMMEQYHYLGYKPLAGAQLRYLIWSGSWLVGGLGFGAAAWWIAPRDQWIGWPSSQREQHLHLIVNNNRFLLLPWLKTPNAASRILGQVARQLPTDWHQRYGYQPVLLETFVEERRFTGTCYKAANWRCLGQTKGRGKLEKNNHQVVPIKQVFVYPLTAHFRRVLCP
jgi:hypothetical protein